MRVVEGVVVLFGNRHLLVYETRGYLGFFLLRSNFDYIHQRTKFLAHVCYVRAVDFYFLIISLILGDSDFVSL